MGKKAACIWISIAFILDFFVLPAESVSKAHAKLQAQVMALQGGRDAFASDESGLLLPPHPDAVSWLTSYRKTGNRRAPVFSSQDTTHSWWSTLFSTHQKPAIVCGRDTQRASSRRKRNVLIVPAGSSWKAEKWLQYPHQATFDIIAIYHGDKPEEFDCALCAAVYYIKGPKWRLYYELTTGPEWDAISNKYSYLMLPDDDLEMDTCTINTVFRLMEQYDILIAQPSVCEGPASGTWRPLLHQRVQYQLRFTTFVEIMSPAFRMDFYNDVIRRTYSRYWTYVGWGLDSIFSALLRYPKDRIAVIDAACMAHQPTKGGLGSSSKPESVYRPGLSPYTAKQEEMIVFSAFNYTSAATAAMGEPFMTARELGGVLNEEVAAAMARSLGAPWPPEGSPLASITEGPFQASVKTTEPRLALDGVSRTTLAYALFLAAGVLACVAFAGQRLAQRRVRRRTLKFNATTSPA